MPSPAKTARPARRKRAPRALDTGHGLIDVDPPRELDFGRFYALSTCSGFGAAGLGLVVAGSVLEIAILGTLVFGIEAKGLERHGVAPFHAAFLAMIAVGLACYALFYRRYRRHFRLRRDGLATTGAIASVVVLSRAVWWRHGRWGDLSRPDMGRFRVRYRYRTGDGVLREGVDEIDNRHGAGDLSGLPEPRRGDRVTVLHDRKNPDDSALALRIGEGLKQP